MTNELPPRTITAIDANASTVESLPITGCVSMMVGGTCNTAGAQLTFSVIFTDSINTIIGTIKNQTLIAGIVADWGALFTGADSGGAEPSFHCVGDRAYIQVTALNPTTATWTLGAAAQ